MRLNVIRLCWSMALQLMQRTQPPILNQVDSTPTRTRVIALVRRYVSAVIHYFPREPGSVVGDCSCSAYSNVVNECIVFQLLFSSSVALETSDSARACSPIDSYATLRLL